MPFTFSHPAIILPLRRFLSGTGLIAGSIAPDFEAFIFPSGEKKFSHTITGGLVFDLPVALIACFAFHLFVRYQLINNLPGHFIKRLIQFLNFDWNLYFKNHFLLVFLSLVIGVASHILWDRLTHPGIITGMEDSITVLSIKKPLYILVQYACSLIGLLYIMLLIYHFAKRPIKPLTSIILIYWTIVFIITISITVVTYRASPHGRTDVIINSSIGGLLAGLILASVTTGIIQKKSREKKLQTIALKQ